MTASDNKNAKVLNSDNIAVLMAGQDFRDDKNCRDHRAVGLSLIVGNGYIKTEKAATYSIKRLAAVADMSPRNIARIRRTLDQHWVITPGHEHQSNRYAPSPEVLSSIDEFWATAGSHATTRINAERGFIVDKNHLRQRLEFPSYEGDAPTWFVDSALRLLPLFQDPDLTLAEKVQRTGIRHHLDLVRIVGQLPSVSLEAKGFEYDIASTLSYTHGWAAPDTNYFRDYMGMKPKTVTRRNADLLASGRWEIVTDQATRQNIYVPTPFLLAQVAAYTQARQTPDQDGNYRGVRMDLPYIIKNLGSLVASRAVELGINHIVGTPDMPTESKHAMVVGKTYTSLVGQAKAAAKKSIPDASPHQAPGLAAIRRPLPAPSPRFHTRGEDGYKENPYVLPDGTPDIAAPASNAGYSENP